MTYAFNQIIGFSNSEDHYKSKLTVFGTDDAAIFQGSNTGTGSGQGFTVGNNGNVNSFQLGNFSENVMSLQHTKSRSVNSFDYDNDGDLDLIFSVFDNDLNIWENRSIDSQFTEEVMGNWVKFNLEGSISNKDALGSIIEVEFEDGSKQITH